MARLEWGRPEDREYETGIDRGVISIPGGVTVPWNGLISVATDEVDGSMVESFLDGVVYSNLVFGGFYEAAVESFGYPVEVDDVFGMRPIFPGMIVTSQPRTVFNFSYRTMVDEVDYKLHIVHNCTATAKGRKASSISDNPSAETLNCVITAVPPNSSIFRPWACLTIDTKTANPAWVAGLEGSLYGTELADPYFPSQEEIVDFITA